MREEIIQTFEVKVLSVDMILGDSDWQPEFNAKINDAGFTFTGGLYVGLDISGGFEDDFLWGAMSRLRDG